MNQHSHLRLAAWAALAFSALLGAGCNSGTSTSSTSSTTATTTSLSTSSTATTIGASITLTATVSSSVATGTVTFYSGSTSLGSATLSSGTATLSTSFSTSGTKSITAVYSGDSSYAASTSSAVSVSVSLIATTTTLGASTATPYPGQSVTLTATVASSSATGTVTFYSNGNAIGTGTLSGGTATLAHTFSTAGAYSLTATYAGDSTYATSSTASATSITVAATGSTGTATILATTSTATTVGASFTLTATVSISSGGVATSANGEVEFYDTTTGTILGYGALASGTGQATLTTSLSVAETHQIVAIYLGDATYAASTSSQIVVDVSLKSTSTALVASSTTPTTATSVTLAATVSPAAATGTVNFYSGASTVLCSNVAVSAGVASCSYTFTTAGAYSVTADYSGDSGYAASSSNAVSLTVTKATTTATATTLSTALATAYPGSLVALTATVSANSSAVSSTTGTVTFSESGTALTCSNAASTKVSVGSSGTAICTTHFSSTGSYNIVATYSGDSTYAASASSSVTETVKSASYSLDLSGYSSSSSTSTFNSVSVTYKYYSNVIYAVNPVDSSYESMNIFIPTSVAGSSVSNMPVLFEIGVGGYMSAKAGSSPGTTNGSYAMSKGYVVVEVGCRGRDLGSSGNYYGVAPAAMVDLKSAVRFLRYNATASNFSDASKHFTGDTDHIIDTGGSAGGALASLLGASGNSSLYYSYVAAIGGADANDNIFAVGAWSPITNLDHADGAYEMEYGSLGTVNSTISSALISIFDDYQDALSLTDKRSSYGTLTHSNITDYILTQFMEPSLAKYVKNGGSAPSYATCAASGSSETCTFTFANYVSTSVGSRGKNVPAFDSFFDSSVSYANVNTSYSAEVVEFGSPTGTASSASSNGRHFTNFSLQKTTGDSSKTIASDLHTIVNMMNPMYYLMNALSSGDASGVAKYWYIRDGTIATDTSAYVIIDLATAVENLRGTSYVDAWEDWGQGHNVETDASGFSSWVTSSVATN